MNGHLFGWSGRPGIDRCACGTERELVQQQLPPGRLYWLFRGPRGEIVVGTERLPWCDVAGRRAA